MRTLRHKILVSIADRTGEKERVVSGTSMRLPQRLLNLLFGEFTDVLVITPGRTVEGIEIRETNSKDSLHHDMSA